jgi:F0F1-type ATP synthase beta subunit
MVDLLAHTTYRRIMNVIGQPIDERGPIKGVKESPIHADAPEFVDQSTQAEVLETGIKVVDLLAPYARGGKIGLFGRSSSITLPRRTVVTRCSPVSASEPVRETTCTMR